MDVSGAFTTVRPGLIRTEHPVEDAGPRPCLLHGGEPGPPVASDETGLLIMTSNLPKRGSEGWKALKAVGPGQCVRL